MENLHGRPVEDDGQYHRPTWSIFYSQSLDLKEDVDGFLNRYYFGRLTTAIINYHDAADEKKKAKAKIKYDKYLRRLTNRAAGNNDLNVTVNKLLALGDRIYSKNDTSESQLR